MSEAETEVESETATGEDDAAEFADDAESGSDESDEDEDDEADEAETESPAAVEQPESAPQGGRVRRWFRRNR